jgi:beta-lactamase superfamily II metal-dependent hydrolase
MARNKYRNPDDSFYVSNFHIKIIVVGYGCFGESTLALMMDGDVVFYSIVIDSYHYKNDKIKDGPYINKTIDILKEYHVERLDVLCWTHPHEDHSKGIPKLIKQFCDGDTKVMFPMYLQNNQTDIIKYGTISKHNIDFILEKNRENTIRANPIGVADKGENNVDEFNIRDYYNSEITANVRIDALTPISSVLTEYVNESLCRDPNELSISFMIEVNGYGMFFGGDTNNKHINLSKMLKVARCRFVKIPHHASLTAVDLTNHLPHELDAVCTTVFMWGKTKLPNPIVVDRYRKFNAEIYSTNKDMRVQNQYGIIEYDGDFSQGLPMFTPSTSGNGGII